MRTRNVHHSQRQRPPIGRSVIMEAGTDPVLGDVGGAQISFGSIAGVDQGDDHQQQPRQQETEREHATTVITTSKNSMQF